MRYGVGGLVVGLLLGVGLGLWRPWQADSQPPRPVVVALITRSDIYSPHLPSALRTALAKNPLLRIVDPYLIIEAIRSRPDEPEMTRNRQIGQQFGARFLIVGNLNIEGTNKSTTIKILEVDSGALLWTKTVPEEAAIATQAAEEIQRHLL